MSIKNFSRAFDINRFAAVDGITLSAPSEAARRAESERLKQDLAPDFHIPF
ncbi:MAG: hypothetical protein LBS62_01975 [Clostridiales bacterium]|nr:hypothetical protein [Clostridiales bacterium]